ncbi:hypothetical protein [Cellulomonas fengjieae]|uniref:hypothetical protein n=1 Tax=Cellulomonas fengjieae TaxID=2819978 RepID=UPI001AAF03F5|nr:hypothetical protein [Cellulomonas fengjieae]MBO3103471.1 hypothetical protein [Cellulomonas fengjieae]
MPATNIQDEAEVIRWFEEGRTYAWMSQEYERKYNIETVPSLWGSFRRRKGLARRITRDHHVIPWPVREEHRWNYILALLRMEARRRAGATLSDADAGRLERFRVQLAESGLVVHYDAETAEGFHCVPRRPGIDQDLIRER